MHRGSACLHSQVGHAEMGIFGAQFEKTQPWESTEGFLLCPVVRLRYLLEPRALLGLVEV